MSIPAIPLGPTTYGRVRQTIEQRLSGVAANIAGHGGRLRDLEARRLTTLAGSVSTRTDLDTLDPAPRDGQSWVVRDETALYTWSGVTGDWAPPVPVQGAATESVVLDYAPPGARDAFNNLRVGASPGSGIVEPGAADNHGNTLVGGGQDGANENLIVGKQMLRTILGGYRNVVNANLASGIIASQRSEVSGDANHANIFGGSLHQITGGAYTTIVGGSSGTADGDFATVIGGNTVSATGVGAVVIGGSNSIASGAQAYSMGANSKAAGNRSAVIGGQANEAHGAESFAGGHTSKTYGMASIALGYQTLVGSSANPTWGDYAASLGGFQNKVGQGANARFAFVAGGRDNEVDVEYGAVVGGRGGKPRHAGAIAQGMGFFTTSGDAQTYRLVARRESTTASYVSLLVDAASRLILPALSAWTFRATITGRCASTGEAAGYVVTGVIKRGATAGTTVLVGAPIVTEAGEDVTGWSVTAVADATNGALELRCQTGEVKTVRWVAAIDVVEVVA